MINYHYLKTLLKKDYIIKGRFKKSNVSSETLVLLKLIQVIKIRVDI